ncbi:hypothetical protein ACWU37_20660 [Photobacterium damselae subsp. damselae]
MRLMLMLFVISFNAISATSIEIEFPVSTIIDKSEFFDSSIIITGLNGMPLTSGDLNFNYDGSFSSSQNIITEAHIFDVETETISHLITSKDSSLIAWSVSSNPIVSASGASDVSSAKALIFIHSIFGKNKMDITSSPLEGMPEKLNRVSWSISSDPSGKISYLNPGDTISVTARVSLEAVL